MDKINILYLIATLDIGGAERQLVELVKRIDKKKFNPIVCCLTRGGPLEQELKETRVEYFILGKKFKFDFSVIFKLISILKQKNIHILHTWMFTSNSFGRMAGIVSQTPIMIASERCVDLWKNGLHLLIDKTLANFTDKIICVSEAVKNFYHNDAYIPLDKMITIYNGIKIDDEVNIDKEKKKKEFGAIGKDNIVTTVGRLAPQKGIEYLLYAVPKILESMSKIKFLIVGEGTEKNKLKKLADKLNISRNIIFTGLRNDVNEILTITDIFVLPSIFEGLPNVIMEVMLSKKPVIATRIPGTDELVVDGETGILVPPKDAESLASAIINVLKNPAKAKEMGINGRKRVEKYFSIDKTVRKTEELYETLIRTKIKQL
ncbi:MAG: glycosyltransferase [Candidatus Omnitrophica bacterium]|nr:glycosyltransferase [Candidatus Omnitrophota bacterium]MBU1047713.1 glycosyltransferase [Candidatus Omnitrophota bacterium]MBU1631286.1 glycosyltransferase [Candidatus Omnitrophota bacterium]MBU1766677.1 glycosyltransferase [Candidatus Omnitrophota bacterium]MBU1888557.1 glycosyltransferase [Candidatus Omnitrophota bacterium]